VLAASAVDGRHRRKPATDVLGSEWPGSPVPAACQNGAQTRDIERWPDDEQTSADQESDSLTALNSAPHC
jgi:hypothetical protein